MNLLISWASRHWRSKNEEGHITLLTKVLIVKSMIFLVDMYGCESWTIKKVEC